VTVHAPLVWMAGAAAAGWLVAAVLFGSAAELFFGILGPLIAVGGSWVMTERTFRRNARAVTSAMIAAFGAKLLFFGAYVAVMLEVVGLRRGPFVASFAASFVGLYGFQAVLLRRLFR
jgi:hypothetical protein